MVLLLRKLHFSKSLEVVQHFPGVGGGVLNANFYRNLYNF